MTAETPVLNCARRSGQGQAHCHQHREKVPRNPIGARQAGRKAGRYCRACSCQPKDEVADISAAASSLASRLHELLHPEQDMGNKLEAVKYRNHLSPSALNDLTVSLQAVEEYAAGYRARLSK